MSAFGDLGLAAAMRLERSVGLSVALRSYRALLDGSDKRVVLAAAIGAMRCAILSKDEPALGDVMRFWRTQRELDGFGAVAKLCRTLVAEGKTSEAADLSAAEVARQSTPRAHYLRARLLWIRGDHPAARAHFRQAIDADDDVATAARCALIADALTHDRPTAADLARQVPLDRISPPQQLLVAEALLDAASPFVRARALSWLEDLPSKDDPALARRACELAALHADRAGASVTWVEAERIAATLAHWPDEPGRTRALSILALLRDSNASPDPSAALERACHAASPRYLDVATALLSGPLDVDFEELLTSADPSQVEAWRALRAIERMKCGDTNGARDELEMLPNERPSPAPPALWTALAIALASHDARLRNRAGDIVLRLTPSGAPPRGFLPHAALLRRAALNHEDLLKRAASRAEPGARDALSHSMTRAAWHAHAIRARQPALALLHKARALVASRTPPSHGTLSDDEALGR